MMKTPQSIAELDEYLTRPPVSVSEAVKRLPGGFAVLGAGGKMGFHVANMLQRALLAAGRNERVLVVSRFGSEQERRKFEQAGFDVRATDLSEEEQVARLPRMPNVIYLAGVKFGTSNAPELLQRMNVIMPRLVAEHFRDSRITALSTGCVYSFTTPESGGSTETDDLDPPGEYARSCLGRERAFTDVSLRHGTPVVLIRLNYAVDLRYGVLVDLAQKVRGGLPISIEMGYVNLIWQGDAVAHILQSQAYATSPPRILNITGKDILRVRDLALRFGERFGRSVMLEGHEAESAWLSNPTLSHDLFGEPRVDLDQMISWTADWIEQGRETLGKPTHFEVRDGAY